MDSRLRGNDGRSFGKNCSPPPCFQTTYCPVGVHCSVSFAHDDDG